LTAEPSGCIIRSGMTTPSPVRSGVSVRLGAGAVIATGLLLVLAATVGPSPAPVGDPGAKVVIRLPDAARVMMLGLLALSAIILLAVQRRRPTGETPAPSPPPRRLPPWAAALVSLLPLLVVVLVWHLVWRYWSGSDGQPIERAVAALAGLLDLLALADKPPTSIPSLDLAITVLLVLLTLGIFALMVLVALADRLQAWWAERGSGVRAPAFAETLARIQSDLRAEPDARLAIIRAYGRFERALAAARAPRAVWQTPAEFMRTTLDRLPVAAAPVRRLTGLFEVARFSAHPLGLEARDAACDCLDEIGTALEEDAARER
jgi:hypothetical protein